MPCIRTSHSCRVSSASSYGISLEQYYDAVATQKNLPQRSTMGQMVAYLKANGGDTKVIAVLEQLTSLHRNPLSCILKMS